MSEFKGQDVNTEDTSSVSTEESTIEQIWYDDWSGLISVEVSDGKYSDIDTTSIEINNAPPLIESIIFPNMPIKVEEKVTSYAEFSDLGIHDTHTAKWEWGDGDMWCWQISFEYIRAWIL